MLISKKQDGSTLRTAKKGSITIKYDGKTYYVPNVKSCTITKETNVFTEATYSHNIQQNGYGVPRISCTFDAVISSQLFTILANEVIGSYDVNVIVKTEYTNGDVTTFTFNDCFFDSIPMSTSLFDGSGFANASFCEKRNIPSICHCISKLLEFNFPLTEGFWTIIATYHKWIPFFHMMGL
jgi:hypothetical protein